MSDPFFRWVARALSALRGRGGAPEPNSRATDEASSVTGGLPPLTYREEIRLSLLELSHLERTTLHHVYRQGMRSFIGDSHSPVLRRLAQRKLLHPMGSSAYPPDAHPYRIPDDVWNALGAGLSDAARGKQDAG